VITLDLIQGQPEWFAAKCGIPSTSNFDKIVTSTGAPSKQREKYLWQLAGERVSGKVAETYNNAIMEKGIEMEGEARNLYEILKDVKVEQVGICYPDEKKLCAASPDGLVGKDGLLEIKCPLIYTHVGYLLKNELPMDYFEQTQGQLYVTGRKWVDFVSYYAGIKPLIIRCVRDEKFIKALAVELEVFCKSLDEITNKIK